ncbi:ABC transporter substrate-binding protein [Alloalcanivorax gelatiniphagus]|uniref:ABC transporter substrate-binding protein n=2 Tax=Alloalcanivorax gelatiniphagus TaxID=1194167 RepID=A0ABY2XQY0_9GAMM|nr:ABC transporter substrate-binding protein [Alloalcanivorax gelatiniphagus]TMW14659.1 ABC transporter substrate-binding protein [Alloalcanivorax gelatiniphagus]|tara:strand:+ start:53152 stop:54147 length:996 start_codon:yes stop_codon:yes gene_type:complete
MNGKGLMRNTLLGALLLVATLCTLALNARADDTEIRIGDMAQSLNGIASHVMIDQGLDHKYGVDLKYKGYPTLDGLFNAIRGKQVDVGFGGWTGFAQFRAQGFPVFNIYPVGRGTSLDVLVPADSDIHKLEDLKGKRVASYAGAAGTATVLLRVVLNDFYQFDPAKDGNLQYVGPGIIPTLLDSGDIDAGLLFDPLATKAIASGKYRSIGNLGDIYKEKTGDDFLWIALATNDDFAEAHPEALSGFLKGWVEAVAYVKSHPQVFQAYGEKLGLDQAGIDMLAERVTRDYATTWNEQYIDGLKAFAERANRVMDKGYLDELPDDAFSTRFVP